MFEKNKVVDINQTVKVPHRGSLHLKETKKKPFAF